MNAVSMAPVASQASSAVAMNSGPLSDRRYRGAPCTLTSTIKTSITRADRMLPATSIAKHSWVNSSTMVRHFNVRPSAATGAAGSPPHVAPADGVAPGARRRSSAR
jgi:hypothetical protein